MKTPHAEFFLLSLSMILLYMLDKCQMNCGEIFDYMGNLLLGLMVFLFNCTVRSMKVQDSQAQTSSLYSLFTNSEWLLPWDLT